MSHNFKGAWSSCPDSGKLGRIEYELNVSSVPECPGKSESHREGALAGHRTRGGRTVVLKCFDFGEHFLYFAFLGKC